MIQYIIQLLRFRRSTPYEAELSAEVLKSEKKRVIVLILFLGALLLFEILAYTVGDSFFDFNPFRRALGNQFPQYHLGIFIGIALVYEAAVYRFLTRAIHSGKGVPGFVRYMNVLIETSFPTMILVLLIHASRSLIPLQLPIIFVYYIFILLSVLRMEFLLSAFSGFVAGSGYFLVDQIFLSLHWIPGPYTLFETPGAILPRSMLMVVAGMIAGFVGEEVRRGLINSLRHMEEKNKVIGIFGQFMSPVVAERLLERRSSDSEVRDVTILFLDIRDFTTFSEKRSPGEVFQYLNLLFQELIQIVNNHNGIINKFLGDGFMAIFGAPVDDSRAPSNAVRAATMLRAKVEEMNRSGLIPTTKVGMGIHCGEAMTGTVGSEERKEYTIIGDAVNLSARVEQLNKAYDSSILITEDVHERIQGHFPAVRLEAVHVKGRREPVTIYRIE